MKINDTNKISASQTVQNQTPSVQTTTPKLLTGVASVPDGFEDSKSKSSSKLMESMAATFKQGVSEMNEDKKHFLQKLKTSNEAAEALSDYLETLVEKSEQLSEMGNGKEEEEDPVISGKAEVGSAVREAMKKEDPFQLKIVKRD